jgi:hypothetical protein
MLLRLLLAVPTLLLLALPAWAQTASKVDPSCRPPYPAQYMAGVQYRKCVDAAYRAQLAGSGNRTQAADAAVVACRAREGALVAAVAKCNRNAPDFMQRFQTGFRQLTRTRLMQM